MKKLRTLSHCILFGALPLAIAGCAATTTIEENPAVAELAPMAKPVAQENQRVHEFDKLTSTETYYDILEVAEDGSLVGRNSKACDWENVGDWVSPSHSWSNCSDDPEWHSGENRNMEKKGEIWPLSVGNKVSYTYTQVNAQGENTGKKRRTCKVTDQVNIDVASGNLDTYKVVCKRGDANWSETQTFYFSPQMRSHVKYIRSSSSEGVTRDTELLRLEVL